MRWILRILKWFPLVLIVALIVGIVFDPLNLIYKRDKSIKRMDSGENSGDGRIPQTREPDLDEDPFLPQGDKSTHEASTVQDQASVQGQSGGQTKTPAAGKKSASSAKRPKDYFMTFDELMSIDKISLGDKLTGMAILSKLKQEDIDKLIEIANGGITMGEFEDMKLILEGALSKEDFAKLNDIMLRNRQLYAEGRLAK